MSTQMVKKLVMPVAGYGTRFLPFTKSIPKPMLPIVDQPIIHMIVEEAVKAGIEQVILITGNNTKAVEDYFDYNLELEYLLEKNGKHEQKMITREASDMASFVYVRQKERLGTGHAILQVKNLIGPNEPFVVVSGDDLFMGTPSYIAQMISAYNHTHNPILLTQTRDEDSDYSRYGYVKTGQQLADNLYSVSGLVEKPGSRADAPSKLASFLCHVLTADIFPIIEQQAPGKGGEIWLAEAISTYAQTHPVTALVADDLHYFDCGNKLEYMKANIEYSIRRQDMGQELKAYIKDLAKQL